MWSSQKKRRKQICCLRKEITFNGDGIVAAPISPYTIYHRGSSRCSPSATLDYPHWKMGASKRLIDKRLTACDDRVRAINLRSTLQSVSAYRAIQAKESSKRVRAICDMNHAVSSFSPSLSFDKFVRFTNFAGDTFKLQIVNYNPTFCLKKSECTKKWSKNSRHWPMPAEPFESFQNTFRSFLSWI